MTVNCRTERGTKDKSAVYKCWRSPCGPKPPEMCSPSPTLAMKPLLSWTTCLEAFHPDRTQWEVQRHEQQVKRSDTMSLTSELSQRCCQSPEPAWFVSSKGGGVEITTPAQLALKQKPWVLIFPFAIIFAINDDWICWMVVHSDFNPHMTKRVGSSLLPELHGEGIALLLPA